MEPALDRNEIVFKTREQLESQLRLVNLYKALNESDGHRKFFASTFDFDQDMDEFQSDLAFSRSIKVKGLTIAHYEDDYKRLQEIRKIQYRTQKTDTLEPSVDNASNIDSLNFSTELARLALNRLLLTVDGVDEFEDTPSLNELPLNYSTQQEFESSVIEVIQTYPEALYENIDVVIFSIPQDKLRAAILEDEPRIDFLPNYSKLKPFFNPAEIVSLVQPFILEEDYADSAFEILSDPDASSFFPIEVRRDMLVRVSKNATLVHDISRKLTAHYNEGILSINDIEEIFVDKIRNFRSVYDFFEVRTLLKSNETTKTSVAKKLNAFFSENLTGEKIVFCYTGTYFLDKEQMLRIIQRTFDRDNRKFNNKILENFQIIVDNVDLRAEFTGILRTSISSMNRALNPTEMSGIIQSDFFSESERSTYLSQIAESEERNLHIKAMLKALDAIKDPTLRKKGIQTILTTCNPANFVDGLENSVIDITTILSPEQIQELLQKTETTKGKAWLYYVFRQRKNAGITQMLLNLYDRHADLDPADVIYYVNVDDPGISESDKLRLLIKATKANPIAAIIYYENMSTISELEGILGYPLNAENILNLAKSNRYIFDFAPHVFDELLGKLSSSRPLKEQKTLLNELDGVYKNIAKIRSSGLEEDFKKALALKNYTFKQQVELLTIFSCFTEIRINQQDESDQITYFGNDIEESKLILMHLASDLLSSNQVVDPHEMRQFFETMTTPVPFISYLAKYSTSESHRQNLSEIFEALKTGGFEGWKYGPDTIGGLNELKIRGLLPESLSLEQYRAWRSDTETNLLADLSSDSETSANALRQYLKQNLIHLEINGIDDSNLSRNQIHIMLRNINKERREIGESLNAVNQKSRRFSAEILADFEITDLKAEQAALTQRRSELARTQAILRLMILSGEEMSEGYLLGGKDNTQKIARITDLINQVEDSSQMENRFVYKQIRSIIDSFRSTENFGMQRTVCSDSSNPKVWIEIGEIPVATCQSYINGGSNEALVGYTEPNTKIVTVKNSNGNIIARSILRLLETPDGVLGLHIERTYSSHTSTAIDKMIYTHAFNKSQIVGIPIFASRILKDENGNVEKLSLPKGFKQSRTRIKLRSKKSRAPSVYVDSSGGLADGGNFELKGLCEILPA